MAADQRSEIAAGRGESLRRLLEVPVTITEIGVIEAIGAADQRAAIGAADRRVAIGAGRGESRRLAEVLVTMAEIAVAAVIRSEGGTMRLLQMHGLQSVP